MQKQLVIQIACEYLNRSNAATSKQPACTHIKVSPFDIVQFDQVFTAYAAQTSLGECSYGPLIFRSSASAVTRRGIGVYDADVRTSAVIHELDAVYAPYRIVWRFIVPVNRSDPPHLSVR